jgi:hypothetical protein
LLNENIRLKQQLAISSSRLKSLIAKLRNLLPEPELSLADRVLLLEQQLSALIILKEQNERRMDYPRRP